MRYMEEAILVRPYDECVHALYEYASRRCGGDRGLAEDVTQEVWLRAVSTWKKDGLPDNPLAWLRTVARNLCQFFCQPKRFLKLFPF